MKPPERTPFGEVASVRRTHAEKTGMRRALILLLNLFGTASCLNLGGEFASSPSTSPSPDGPSKPASLSAWLNAHPTIRDAIRFEDAASDYLFPAGTLVENKWEDWSAADKQALAEAFDRQWTWLYKTTDRANNQGVDEFTTPVSCLNCAANLVSNPNDMALTLISETTAKSVFFANVAHALAVEIGGAVEWSILSEDASSLHNYFNSRAMMYRYGANFVVGQPNFEVNAREKYIGDGSPATPRFIFAWMESQDLLKSTRTETIYAFLEWTRQNVFHYFGATTYANTNDHWLTPGKPPIDRVLTGTVSTSHGFGHWTAGCHGTAALVKAVMRALNIPVESIYTCGHAQIYFPSAGLYLDHGDNPYNLNVTASARPISELLIDQATYTGLFSATPDFLNPADPNCANIGQSAANF